MSNSRQLQFSISDLIGFTIACSLLAFTIHAFPRDSTVSVIAIVGMLYSTKFFINLRAVRQTGAVAVYMAAFAACLAGSYAMTDWNNTDTSHGFKIVIFPLAILAVPTVTFIHGVGRVSISNAKFALRALIEICVFLPMWYAACMFFALMDGMLSI